MSVNRKFLQELEAYRCTETLKLAAGKSLVVQQVLAENPLKSYPDHLLNDYLRKSPPVDYKMCHPPCADIVLHGGGDPLVCRDDRFSMCFSWCLVDVCKTYAASRRIAFDEIDDLVVEYRKWWGIVSLHGDRAWQYPPSLKVLDFWREHVRHTINYQNFCRYVGRHGPLSVAVSSRRKRLLRQRTLPAYQMIYGPDNFPSRFWDGVEL